MKFWAFVANPDKYDILRAIADATDTWTTAGQLVKAGDRGIIWKAAGKRGPRGVVALVEILSDPIVASDAENPRWRDAEGRDAPKERVQVRYVRAPDLPLWEPDSFLESLNVSRARGSTVLPLTQEVWVELERRAGGWHDAGLNHRHYQGVPEQYPLIAGGDERDRPVIMLGTGKRRARLPPVGWHKVRAGERELWAKLARVAINKVSETPDDKAPNILASIVEEWFGIEPWKAGKKHRVEIKLVDTDVLEMRAGKDRLWTREEMILALDLHVNRPAGLEGARDTDIQDLADFLGRTRGSVGLKIGNFKSIDPAYTSTGRKGLPNTAGLEAPLFEEWAARPAELRAEAERVRLRLVGAPDATGEAIARRSLWDRLGAMSRKELEALVMAKREKTIERSSSATTTRRETTQRVGQADFAHAVLAEYYLYAGEELRAQCPGCGHGRSKANDAPVLEAHHVVPFSETKSLDARWGVPVCLNCHELLGTGDIDTKREIYGAIRQRYTRMSHNLVELVHAGLAKALWIDLMLTEGALDADPRG